MDLQHSPLVFVDFESNIRAKFVSNLLDILQIETNRMFSKYSDDSGGHLPDASQLHSALSDRFLYTTITIPLSRAVGHIFDVKC